MRDFTFAVCVSLFLPLSASAATVASGRVVAGPIANGIEPKPIASARVLVLRSLDAKPGDGAFTVGVTTADGLFRVDAEAVTDPLHIVVEAVGRETLHRVVSAAAASPLEFVLLVEARLEGTVADRVSLHPLADARVVIAASRPMNLDQEEKPDGVPEAVTARIFPSAMADRNGGFQLAGLAPRSYTVTVTRPGYFTDVEPALATERGRATQASVALLPSSRLEVTVLGVDGKALAGARVRFELEPALIEPLIDARITTPVQQYYEGVATDSKGVATFPEVTPRVPVNLVVSHDGFGEEPVAGQTAAAGETARLNVRLREGVKVSGVVVDEAGEPVAEAVVHLREPGWEPKRPAMTMGGRRDREAASRPGTTSAVGAFHLPRVPPGDYEAWVKTFGRDWNTREIVSVRSGRPITDLDVRVELGPRLEGIVIDDLGVPVPDAKLHALVPGRGSLGGRPQTRSREDGSFTLRGVPGKTCALSVWGREGLNHASLENVPTDARDVKLVLTRAGGIGGRVLLADGTSALTVFVTPNPVAVPNTDRMAPEALSRERVLAASDGIYQLADLAPGTWNISLNAPGHLSVTRPNIVVKAGAITANVDAQLERGTNLRGTVIDAADRRPVTSAEVEAFPSPKPERMSWGMPTGSPRAATDSSGSFELAGLAKGRAVLVVTHPAYTGIEIEVAVGDDAGPAEIALSRGGTIEGRVVDGDGTPEAATQVVIDGEGQSPPTARRAVTDATGGFLVDRLAAGRYEVIHDGFFESGGWSASETVEVKEGQVTTVTLRRPGGRLMGRVLNGAIPIAGARLMIFGKGGGRAMAVSRKDGSYEALGVGPGNWHVSLNYTKVGGDEGRVSADIDVPGGNVFVHDFVVGAVVLRGRVEDGESGLPIAGARVSARGDAAGKGSASAETDGDGRFELELAEEGAYTFIARHADYARAEPVAIDVKSVPAEVRLVLSRGDLLSGRVLDASGAPIPDVTVMALAGEKGIGMVRCERDGTFALPLARGSVVRLVALASSRAPAILDGLIPGADPIAVVMTRGGSLAITLPPADPSAPITLELRDASSTDILALLQRSHSNDLMVGSPPRGGSVRFPHLAPGPYRVVARLGEVSKTVETVVGEGSEVAIAIGF